MIETVCPICVKVRLVSRFIKPRNCYSCASKLACTPEKRAKMALASKRTLNGFKLGHKPYEIDKEKHRKAVSEGRKKRFLIPENRLKASAQGKRLVLEGKCPFWKGGLTKQNQIIRESAEYGIWRRAVYERDGYTCVECKIRGGKLNADHIKPFALFPEFRFELSNGRTLCVPCHRKTDTWGRRSLSPQPSFTIALPLV